VRRLTIFLVTWGFLAVGIAFLVGYATAARTGSTGLLLLGFCFASIGGGVIGYAWWKEREAARLRRHGLLIQADFREVERNSSLDVNGVNPFRVVAQWHEARTNRLYVFRSDNLWFDPTSFIKQAKIPVYVDRLNPSKYWVDISFLPELHD
jgi:hypothetical protein